MTPFMDITKLASFTQKIKELEEENAKLKEMLGQYGIEYKCENIPKGSETLETKIASTSEYRLSLQEKVAIFQELF